MPPRSTSLNIKVAGPRPHSTEGNRFSRHDFGDVWRWGRCVWGGAFICNRNYSIKPQAGVIIFSITVFGTTNIRSALLMTVIRSGCRNLVAVITLKTCHNLSVVFFHVSGPPPQLYYKTLRSASRSGISFIRKSMSNILISSNMHPSNGHGKTWPAGPNVSVSQMWF